MDIGTIVDEGLGNASYVVDLGDGRALAVDPERDPGPYLEEAARRDLRVAFTADTHLHNDFVSGSRDLQELGATVLAGSEAHLEFPHRGLRDGEEMDLGGLTLRALATPGHTPEHTSYLLLDGSRSLAVFTGGSLLRGSVARTDLLGPERAEPLARALYRSVRDRLFGLPDDLAVYPTHGAGATFCAAAPTDGTDPRTTIGREKGQNPFLLAPDEDTFVRDLLANRTSYPRYFRNLREVNRRGPTVYGGRAPSLGPLRAADVRRLLGEGTEVIDVRPVEEFAAGHVPGALSIELRPAFATWLGWVVPGDRPVVFVLSEHQDRMELVRQCLKIGFERLAGELAGGMAAWREAGLGEARLSLVQPGEAVEATFLDVRQRAEFEAAHIPEAIHTELGSLDEMADSLPPGPLTLHCGHGERAVTGASLLERRGWEGLAVLLGGPRDWSRTAGRALVPGRPA